MAAAPQASLAGSNGGTYASTWGPRPELQTYGGGDDGLADVPGIGALRRGGAHAHLSDVFAADKGGAAARARDLATKEDDEANAEDGGDDGNGKAKPKAQKFGMLDGVLARCLVQIWGVIIFLRLGWLVGYAGIGLVIAIVVISSTITTITTLSLSAISTNGRVQGGGAYFLISRSLGPELGGAIGVLFAAANAVAIALYLIGLAETVVDQIGAPIIDAAWDLRIIAFILLGVLTALVFVGISVVIKFQLGLLLLLILAFASFIAGVFLDPKREGADPAALAIATRNWEPSFDGDAARFPAAAAKLVSTDGTVTFATCLALFFPAATGIMAGANISGDLKNPRTAIPNGTLLAIGLSALVYIGLIILIGSAAARTVLLPDGTYGGLLHDTALMAKLSAEPWLVNLGIYAATLSSALASLVGAPRILQAVAKDNLFPFLRVFGNGYGGNEEPLEAYALSVVIAAACIAIGELNLVAPLTTSLFLLSYFLVNYACFAAEISRSPGWRPTFRYYSKYSAALGAIVCLGMLLFLDVLAGVVSIVITVVLYLYVKNTTAASVNWGSASEGSAYMAAVRTLSALQRTQRHVKNWRPQFLVLVGGTLDARLRRAGLVHFMRHMSKGKGVNVFARVLTDSFEAFCARKAELFPTGSHPANELPRRELLRWLHRLRAPGFAQAVVSGSLRTGVQSLLQLGGLGQLRPNAVVLGHRKSWRTAPEEGADEYVGIIGDAFDMDCGVVVVCGVREYESLTAEKDEVARRARSQAAKVMAKLEEEGLTEAATRSPMTAKALGAKPVDDDDEDDEDDDGELSDEEAAATTKAVKAARAAALGAVDDAAEVRDDPAVAATEAAFVAAAAEKPPTRTVKAATLSAAAEATGAGDVAIEVAAAAAAGAPTRSASGEEEPAAATPEGLSHVGRLLSGETSPGRGLPVTPTVPDLMGLFERDGDEGGNAAAEAGQADDEDGAGGCCSGVSRACGARLSAGEGKGSRIDVWWLSDDGGLTVMLPHLLSRCRRWRGASIRVYVVSNDGMTAVAQQRQMQDLLGEVRIAAECVAIHNETPLSPSEASLEAHAELGVERADGAVTDKTKAYLRMGEIIAEHSHDASVVFASLPVPRQGGHPRRFLSWMDALASLSRPTATRKAVPVILVRGNNTPVLTYFS